MLRRHFRVSAIFILFACPMVCIQPLPPSLPPPPSLPIFLRIRGPCVTTNGGSCVASPNYPGPYDHSTCYIDHLPRLPLVVNSFRTELSHALTVNKVVYSGEHGPDGIVPAEGIIAWYADTNGTGWELCWVPPLPPVPAPLPPPSPPPPPSLGQPIIAILSGGVVVTTVLLVCLLHKLYRCQTGTESV